MALNVMLWEMYFVLLAFAVLAIRNKRISIDRTGVLLFLFTVSYMLFYGINEGFASIGVFRVTIVFIAYLLGYSFYTSASFKQLSFLLILMTVAMAAHSIINMFYNGILYGSAVFYSGITKDIWSGEISSATGQAAYYFMISGTLGYVVSGKGEKGKRLLLLAVYIVVAIHNILLGGRTILVLSAISLIVAIGYILTKSRNRMKAISVALICVAVAILVYFLYSLNLFGIKTMFESSYFYYRFFVISDFGFESDRMARRMTYIANMLKYPLGGNHIRKDLGVGYAHDLWLDIFDDAGLITFILLLFYTILTVYRLLKFLKKSKNENVNILLSGIQLALLASFFTEPILNGCPSVLFMYCFFDGIISKMLKAKVAFHDIQE